MNPQALRAAAIAIVIAIVALGGYSILQGRGGGDQGTVLTELEELAPASVPSTDVPSPDAEDDFPAVTTAAVRDAADRNSPVELRFSIVDTLPHDTGAFTQGLEIADGRLFESTGLVGRSSIRELDLATGDIVRNAAVDEVFAEGLTVISDGGNERSAIQLTWQDGIAYRYDADTFDIVDTYTYEGEGWGLCHDGTQLVMSDGTPTLDFRDASTFELISSVEVTLSGSPISMLNELECVNGSVWANIWQSSLIIEIDPTSGNVIGVLNAATLTPPSVAEDASAVLNGIAYDPSDGTFLLTGKLWPTIFRVQIEPAPQ